MKVTEIETIKTADPNHWLDRIHRFAQVRAAAVIKRENLARYRFSPWRDDPIFNIRNYEIDFNDLRSHSDDLTSWFTGVHCLQITDREFWETLSEDPQYSLKFAVTSNEIHLLLFKSTSSLYHFLERQVKNIGVFSVSEKFPDFALELYENVLRLYDLSSDKRAPINDLVKELRYLLREWIQDNSYNWDTEKLLRPANLANDMDRTIASNTFWSDDKLEDVTFRVKRGEAEMLSLILKRLAESIPANSSDTIAEDRDRIEMSAIKSLQREAHFAATCKSS